MRRIATVLLVATLAACGDSAGPAIPANSDVTGAWTLRTYNGSAPPATISQLTGVTTEVMGDRYSINPDGNFMEVLSARVTKGSSMWNSDNAWVGMYSYSNVNGAVEFQTSPTATYHGTVAGDTLTVLARGGTWVFGRESPR